jgi:hypothetical protein
MTEENFEQNIMQLILNSPEDIRDDILGHVAAIIRLVSTQPGGAEMVHAMVEDLAEGQAIVRDILNGGAE